jgi:hypothetical protein
MMAIVAPTEATTAPMAATTAAPPITKVARHLGPPSTLGPAQSRCGQVQGFGQQPQRHPQAMMAGVPPFSYIPHQVWPASAPPLVPVPVHTGLIQQQQAAIQSWSPAPAWHPWVGSWDQQSLANSFNTMTLHPSILTDWVTDSGTSNHTTPDSGNISLFHPPNSNMSSSIVAGNGSVLPITSVGDSVLPGPLYLNNIIIALDIIQNLLFVHQFTTDNSCSMEFDPFGLSVKDLATRNVIIKSNSSGPIYTLRLSTRAPAAHALTAALLSIHGTIDLVTLATMSSPDYLALLLFIVQS